MPQPRYADEVDCEALGRKVSVRYLLPDGGRTDVVGVLETCDDEWLGVRDRRGELHRVERAVVVGSRVVRAPLPSPRRRD